MVDCASLWNLDAGTLWCVEHLGAWTFGAWTLESVALVYVDLGCSISCNILRRVGAGLCSF